MQIRAHGGKRRRSAGSDMEARVSVRLIPALLSRLTGQGGPAAASKGRQGHTPAGQPRAIRSKRSNLAGAARSSSNWWAE